MEHNELRKKLREELPLPNELGWEQMQEGILEQMATAEQDRRGAFFFFNWKKLLVVSLLILNFSIMAYLIHLVQEKEELGAFPVAVEQPLSSHDPKSEESILESKTNTESPNKNLTNKITTPKSTENQLLINKNTSTSLRFLNNFIERSYDEEVMLYDVSEQRTVTNNSPLYPTIKYPIPTNKLVSQNAAFATLNSIIHPIESQKKAIVFPTANPKIEVITFKPHYALELSGGMNNWNTNYDEVSTEQNIRSVNETELTGYQLAANLKYYFNPNWYASTGLAFQQLNHRFNYENIKTEQVEERDALVGIAINSISGDSTFIRQDRSVDVTQKRSVQHYNQHQLLSIPVHLGYEWNYKRLALSGNLGGVFSVRSFSKGKTWVDSEIATYDRENQIYKKRFGLGVSAQVQLNYTLTNNFYIGGNIGHSNWLQNWSAEPTIRSRPSTTQISIILGRKF
ncbi:MAG: hypothetical protein AAGG68_08125 [Bacteroidota bacterium]